jgi:fructoselysine-6-P-deglycase FrlB-like protein
VSEIAREIASQPACWREAAQLAARSTDALPASGGRVCVVGCGTSLYMAQTLAALREGAGQGETDAFAASEAPLDRPYETVIAISRSATTTEVVRYLREVSGPRRVAIVAVVVGMAIAWPMVPWVQRIITQPLNEPSITQKWHYSI